MNLVEILSGAHVALKLIQARLLVLIAMIICAVLFGLSMWLQTWLGLMIAATWGLVVFLPVLYTGRGGFDGNQGEERQHSSREPAVRAEDRPQRAAAEPDDN